MDVIGLALSVPFSFVASIIYGFIIKKLALRWNFMVTPLQVISLFILAGLILEIIGLIYVGAPCLYNIFGEFYHHNWHDVTKNQRFVSSIFNAQSIIFFFAVPSLINIMKLQKKYPIISKWYVIAMASAIIGFLIVALQYDIDQKICVSLYPHTGECASEF